MLDLTPGIRSLQIHIDPSQITVERGLPEGFCIGQRAAAIGIDSGSLANRSFAAYLGMILRHSWRFSVINKGFVRMRRGARAIWNLFDALMD